MPHSNQFVATKGSIFTLTSQAATTTSNAINFGLFDTYSLWVNVTGATGTTPTLDIVLQTSVDKGTTYIDLPLRFAQKTTTAAEVLVFKIGLGNNEVALGQAVADTGGSLAKNCVFDPAYMKIKCTIGGTNPTFTAAFYLMGTPPNWNTGS